MIFHMEQFELQFEAPLESAEQSIEELAERYAREVGVPPRSADRDGLLAALKDPEAERDRLREEDADDDRQEILKTYRRA